MAPKQEGCSGPRVLGPRTHNEPQTRAHGDLGLRWERELEFRKSVSFLCQAWNGGPALVRPGWGTDEVFTQHSALVHVPSTHVAYFHHQSSAHVMS